MNNSSEQVMEHMQAAIDNLPGISREELEEFYLAVTYINASAQAIGDKKITTMINSALLISRSMIANKNGDKNEAIKLTLKALAETLEMDDSNNPLVNVLKKVFGKERA